jgi:hypothetical protein
MGVKRGGGPLYTLLFGLFLFQDAFEPVTNKGTYDKDNHVDDNHDKNIKYSQETGSKTYAAGNKDSRDEHKGNTQNETDNRSIPEDTHEVFLPPVKKPKCYADDEIQQVKPHANTPFK